MNHIVIRVCYTYFYLSNQVHSSWLKEILFTNEKNILFSNNLYKYSDSTWIFILIRKKTLSFFNLSIFQFYFILFFCVAICYTYFTNFSMCSGGCNLGCKIKTMEINQAIKLQPVWKKLQPEKFVKYVLHMPHKKIK